MQEILESLFKSDYMPHGMCYLWRPEILWLNIVSDILIALAYFSIPVAIYYFVKKREDLEFKGIFILFSLFILFCGITHVISIFVIWHGAYGIHGMSKLITGVISVITAYKLFQAIPFALTIPSQQELKDVYERANREEMERVKLESEQQQNFMLRESTDSAHVGILVLSDKGIIQVANKAACTVFEYSKDNIEGKNIDVILPKIGTENNLVDVHTLLNNESVYKEVLSDNLSLGKTKTGQNVPVEVTFNKRFYGDKSKIFVSFQDVSERLANQKALADSEMMTRSIIASLPLGLHVISLKQDEIYLTDFNNAAVDIIGVDHNIFLGLQYDQAFPNLHNTPIYEAYKTIAKEGGTWSNDTLEYEDNNIAGIFDVICFQSSPNTAIILFEDISDKYKSQQILKEKDQFIKLAFDSSITGCYVFNVNEGINEYINSSYTHILGYALDELNAMDQSEFRDLFHDEDRVAVFARMELIANSKHNDEIPQIEYRFKHKNGNWVWCLTSDKVLERNEEGEVLRFMGSFLDITELKTMQLNLIELKNQAQQANIAKSDFLANMSHEIRTPMNAILGLTHLVLNMELGKKQFEYLSKVESASKSLLNILNDILDYSKMEAGKLDIVKEDINIEEMIEASLGLFTLMAEEKNLEFVAEISPDIKQYYLGDQLRISQILNNLIGNAVKFTQSGHVKITVNTDPEKANVIVFSVEDSGIGITKEQISRLFESFTQADSSVVREFGGTGLGLSISRALAHLMDGKITVDSVEGKGSVFSLHLPLQISELQAIESNTVLKPMRTLVVDDNEPSRLAIVSLLTSWGFEVDECFDGEQALQQLTRNKAAHTEYELLIVDWKMPKLDGLELIQRLQNDPKVIEVESKVVVLMVTAYGRRHAEQYAQEEKIDAFLDKPILNSRLKETLLRLQLGKYVNDAPSSRTINELGLSTPQFTQSKVLIVEDNYTNQIVASEFLSKFGVNFTIANNGEEAVNLFKKHNYDLVLMDLQMPIMDGFTATKLILETPKGKRTPIIAMSAAVMKADIDHVEAVGMKGHIAKPIDINNLQNVLEKWLELTKSPKEPPTPLLKSGLENKSDLNSPSFEVESAIAMLGGNERLYFKTLYNFNQDNKKTSEELLNLQNDSDQETLIRVVHTLSGLAGTIGAAALRTIAKDVESKLLNGEKADINSLRKELDLAISEAENLLLKQKFDGATKPSKEVKSWPEERDNILSDLSSGKFLSSEDIEPILVAHLQKVGQKSVEAILSALNKLDYAEVRRLIMDIA